MSSSIQNILKVANKLFSSNSPNTTDLAWKSNYSLLVNLMSKLKASDVNFNQTEIDRKVLVNAPCAYLRLFENQYFNLSIFSIKSNSRLPLHNHPGMHGFIRVLSGKIRIKNFDLLPVDIESTPKNILDQIPTKFKSNSIVPTLQLEDKVVSSDDQNLGFVEPIKGNIHEITMFNSASDCKTGSAFLDLIAPPYDNCIPGRTVTYYQIIGKSHSDNLSKDITWLVEIPQPDEYWCEYVNYNGPELSERILNQK